MAGASDDDLKKMVENWKSVQTAQEKAAGSLADTKVDFENQLNDIQTDLEAAVEKMSLDDEAKKAATDTIQAYANGLIAGKGMIAEAGDIVKSAAINALNAPAFGGGAAQGLFALTPSAHDAVGTDYATPGLALVGERGPELVNFNGGEQVLTAAKTNALLSGNSGGGETKITIAPVIQISGNADNDTVQQAMNEVVEQIKEALREAGIDARRGAYV